MKTFISACFALILAGNSVSFAAELSDTNVPAQAMIHAHLKQEGIRLDATFLEGITNRQQWEAQRGELRREYLDMLGLWPLPERTPLNPVVTGVLQRDEGFRVEEV